MEMLVVLGITVLVMGAVVRFQFDVFRLNQSDYNQLSTIQDAPAILSSIVKELRSTSVGNNGSFAINQAATSSLTFFSDTDGDGLKEQIRYFLSGTLLRRGSIKPTGLPLSYVSGNETFRTLASNVKNAPSSDIFQYYDDSYDGTTTSLAQPVTTTDVHLIKINLLLDVDPNRSPVPILYSSSASLRNLKDNL